MPRRRVERVVVALDADSLNALKVEADVLVAAGRCWG